MHDLDRAKDFIDTRAAAFIQDFAPDVVVVLDALVAGEDHRGDYHGGIDVFSIVRGVVSALARGGRVRGISTVEQQIARVIYPRGSRPLLGSKLAELRLAAQLGRDRPKFAIWLAYLQSAYFGAHMQGYAAARGVFAAPGASLERDQAAAIISCLKYPRPDAPSANWLRRHAARKAYVLSRMAPINPRRGW